MVIGCVELFLRRKYLGLIKTVDPTRDVRVLELSQLLPPLGQGKVHKLALRSELHGNTGEFHS